MTPDQSKQFVKRLYDELIDGVRLDLLDEIVDPEFVDHTPLPGLSSDREGLKRRLLLRRDAFPDFRSAILDLVVEGEKVVAMMTSTGTHRGSFLGVRPTGKRATIMEIHQLRIREGRLLEFWGLPDLFGLFVQLGVVSPPWERIKDEGGRMTAEG